MGQHRLMQVKNTAYEEDVRVTLIIRGPSVPAAKVVDALAGNIDLASTFADIAGAATPAFVDGRSLLPWLGDSPPAKWRAAFLLEKGDPMMRYLAKAAVEVKKRSSPLSIVMTVF